MAARSEGGAGSGGPAGRARLVSPFVIVAVLAALELLWMRFNARPGPLEPGTDAWRMAVQGDLLAYYLPMLEKVAARLGAGELPLWNPNACSGIPLLATLQSGAFYPGNWLAVMLPAHHAISWLMFGECALAGISAAWLFRVWGHSEVASAMGGVLFLFGCVFGQVLWPPAVSSLMWIPWLLLSVERIAVAPRFRWWLALVAGVALQLLAGFPQYQIYGFYIVAPFALLRLAAAPRRGRATGQVALRLAAMASGVALGVGVASVQLLPSLELVGESMRQAALGAADVHYLSPWDPFQSGDVLRAAIDPTPRFISFNLGSGGGYLGITTLVLALLAIVEGPRSARTWFWIALGGAALILSDGLLGWSAPLYRLYMQIPVVGALRTPERIRVVTFFCVIVLAVSGFDALRGAVHRKRFGVAAVGIALLIGCGMALDGHAVEAWRVVASLGLVLVLVSERATRAHRRGAEIALLALVVLDLVLATAEHGVLRQIPVGLSNRYASADRRTALPEGFFEHERDEAGLARIELVGYRPRIATAPSDGGYRASCYEPLVPAQWAQLERRLARKPAIGATLYDLDPERYATFYDVASVSRILEEPTEGRHQVRENDDALPRAYLVNSFQIATREEAFRHILLSNVDFRAQVLLESDPGSVGAGFPWPEIEPAEITSYEPERVVVEVRSPGPALLVLTDTYYPGWRASVDGDSAEIFRANGLYRAVRVGRGPHRVVFEYVPASLRVGAAVSLASLAGVAAVGLLARRRAAAPRRSGG